MTHWCKAYYPEQSVLLIIVRGNLFTENHFQNVQNIFPHKDCCNLIFNFLLLFRTTHLNFEVGKRGNNGQGHYWLYVSFTNSL